MAAFISKIDPLDNVYEMVKNTFGSKFIILDFVGHWNTQSDSEP